MPMHLFVQIETLCELIRICLTSHTGSTHINEYTQIKK